MSALLLIASMTLQIYHRQIIVSHKLQRALCFIKLNKIKKPVSSLPADGLSHCVVVIKSVLSNDHGHRRRHHRRHDHRIRRRHRRRHRRDYRGELGDELRSQSLHDRRFVGH